MAKFYIFAVYVFLLFPILAISVPQIFSEVHSFCEYKFTGMKKIPFVDKLWTIDNREFVLHFSLCNTVQEVCRNETSSCVFRKSNNEFINLGHEFRPADSDDPILVSSNGAKCNSDQNYSISVSLFCSESVKPKPRLMASDDDCVFEVTMMLPNCQPRCTETVLGSKFIDIRKFPKNIQVQSDNRRFSLSLCGSNKNCPEDVSACEIKSDSSVTSLAIIDSQLLVYNVAENELTARGRIKEFGEVRDIQVLIRCNWETEAANPTYVKVPAQGKHYRFQIESSYGCIKLPPDCHFTSIEKLNYDLSKLYTLHGWTVAKVPSGKVFLNICGPLKLPPNRCSDQYSQVCQVINNDYRNFGSILTSFQAQDDIITAQFVSGSTCLENSTLLYSTHIELKCSKSEKGPQFQQIKNCVMFIFWETPHACPVDLYKGHNCYISDRISNRDLRKLYTNSDKIYPLSPNNSTKLIYNLCGPIHQSCNNFTNVSFCLKTPQKEIVIGWHSREVISENGLLRMEFSGSLCQNNKSQGEIFVNLVCSYENPSPSPELHVVQHHCNYNMTVFSPLACIAHGNFSNCVYHSENLTYDLTPLALKNKNYVIRGDSDLDYVFNVCGPIISGPGALCMGDTMFCQRNKTEVAINHRYMSLGGVSGPRLQDNKLVLVASLGAFCANLGFYKSVMRFECSQTEVSPRFVSKDTCVYNFVWQTPQACPKIRNCTINSSSSDLTFDLTMLKNKVINLEFDDISKKYEFYLCKDIYTTFIKNISQTKNLHREYLKDKKDSYVILDLNEKCSNTTPVIKIILRLECSDKVEEYFEKKTIENCILNMTLHAHIFCANKQNYLVYDTYDISELTTTAKPNNKTDCIVSNGYTGYEFNLNKIKSEEILQKGNDLQINLDQETALCEGIFCKNGRNVIPAICPATIFDYKANTVKIHYLAHTCDVNDSYQFEILLQCNNTKSAARIIEDAKCKTVVLYNLQEACFLLKKDIMTATPVGAIVGGTIAVIVVIIAVLVFVIYKKRLVRLPYIQIPLYSSKTSVPCYYRNGTE